MKDNMKEKQNTLPFSERKLFGTDGIRGEAGKYPIIPEMVVKIGRSIASSIEKNRKKGIIIGHDGRDSAVMIENSLKEGINSVGVDVLSAGLLPTPAVAFLTRELGLGAGIVISASHNPFQDNGIKVFSPTGDKLDDITETAIEALILSPKVPPAFPGSTREGRSGRMMDGDKKYLKFLEKSVPDEFNLAGISMVIDCANGATSFIAPEIFYRLGAEVKTIFADPDGRNINSSCGSQYPQVLANEVINCGADLGLAFDGDGDRLIAVDENGEIVTGDKIIFICGKKLKQDKKLPHDLVVCTVMSNLGLHQAFAKCGIRVEVTDVGDRYVMERMKQLGAVLGGEDSGHLIFLNHHTTGDGIISALQLLSVIKNERTSLSQLASGMSVFPQRLINVPVQAKPDLSSIAEISEEINALEDKLGDSGRILVRYSGTQPVCRVMVEGPTKEETERYCRKIANVIEKNLNR